MAFTGCRHYADFQLPPAQGPYRPVEWHWTPQPDPVLRRGAGNEFDRVDTLNPSIVRHKGTYWNFYSGWDGKSWRTGLAQSSDGIEWRKEGVILAPESSGWEGSYIAANGAARFFQGQWHVWYQAGSPPRIGLARSPDGRSWAKEPKPVMETGPRGAWDERGVGDPYVIEAGGRLYMYFLGQDRASRQRLGVAVSDDGRTWTKLRSNPILELGETGSFDETGLGEPAVWEQFGRWWMLYTGRDRREWRRTGLAVSEDGVKWKRVRESPILPTGEGWNSKVICDPEVEVRPDGVRVWFGGGDQPQPAENLNGQIGVGMLAAK